jgi:hypothetical protein
VNVLPLLTTSTQYGNVIHASPTEEVVAPVVDR